MSDAYLTIETAGEAVVREKMSRFLAFARHVESVDEAKAVIAEYGRQYHDARHVCWAYMLGPERKDFLSSDNGEPSGTAGKPILGQINSRSLTDIVVVVVRYFGGIKLGTSGLIAAYRQAASDALDTCPIVERHTMVNVTHHFGYLDMDRVMRIIRKSGAKIVSQDFDNDCTVTVTINADAAPELEKKLNDSFA